MITPPLNDKKRKIEYSGRWNKQWTCSKRGDVQAIKHQRLSLKNWINGLVLLTKNEGVLSSHTLLKSTPVWQTQKRTEWQPEGPPNLCKHLSMSGSPQSESMKRSKTYLTKSLGGNLRKMMEDPVSLDEKSRKTKCPGSVFQPAQLEGAAALKHVKPCNNLVRTYLESNHSYGLQITSMMEYPPLSGTGYSEVKPSTSIRFSCQCILSNLMKGEKEAWEQLRLCLQWQSQNDKLKLGQSGQRNSGDYQKQSLSFPPTKERNCLNMLNTLKVSSPPNRQVPTRESSCMSQYDQSVRNQVQLEEVRIPCSLIITASTGSAKQYSMLMVLNMTSV